MRAYIQKARQFARNVRGATAVEYGLIAALMTVAMVGALSGTGTGTKAKWDGVANKVADASGG